MMKIEKYARRNPEANYLILCEEWEAEFYHAVLPENVYTRIIKIKRDLIGRALSCY